MITIEFALAQIESADASLASHDGPERILGAVLDACDLDAAAIEGILACRAADALCRKRLNYIRALMYLLAYNGNTRDSTVKVLIEIAGHRTDPALKDAATLAIAWNFFENASEQSFRDVYRFLRETADRPPLGLTDHTLHVVRANLALTERHKAALDALASGQLVIAEELVREILSQRGEGSFHSLGFHPLNADRLIRLLACTSVLIRRPAWYRKWKRNHAITVETTALGPRGLPHANIKVTWKRDKLCDRLVLCDATVET